MVYKRYASKAAYKAEVQRQRRKKREYEQQQKAEAELKSIRRQREILKPTKTVVPKEISQKPHFYALEGGRAVYDVGGKRYELSPEEAKTVLSQFRGAGTKMTPKLEEMKASQMEQFTIQRIKEGYPLERLNPDVVMNIFAKHPELIPEDMKQQLEALKQQEKMKQQIPEKRELMPESPYSTHKWPLVGSSAAVLSILYNELPEPVKKVFPQFFGEGLPGVKSHPEILRTAVQTEIERKVYEQGLSDNQRFGALVEAVPAVGSLVGKYAGSFIETPSENIKTIHSEITSLNEKITIIRERVSAGDLDAEKGALILDNYDRDLQELESKIRMYLDYSATLRYNSDYVNKIEEDILGVRQRIYFNKLAIARAPIKREKTDAELLYNLLKAKGEI